MAILIAEPAPLNPATQDWGNLLSKLTFQTGGLMIVDFTEKNTLNIPMIRAGSRFEINGSFFRCITDESISGFLNMANNRFCYVYAVPSANLQSADFQFIQTPPVYNVTYNGWYHPDSSLNYRCILSAYKVNSTTCRGKSMIDHRVIYQPVVGNNGHQIFNSSMGNLHTIEIEAGWYRVVLRGGTGGMGGMGGNSGDSVARTSFAPIIQRVIERQLGGHGHPGIDSIEQSFIIWLEKGTVQLYTGRAGATGNIGGNGQDGTDNTMGSGNFIGGDGAQGSDGVHGESSYLLNNGKMICQAMGGQGGQGGQGGIAGFVMVAVDTQSTKRMMGARASVAQGYTDFRHPISLNIL